MIELQELSKRYRETLAVDRLSLQIPAGEIFGFLGPNGAGKTTTIRMMMGLLLPTAGRVILGGYDLQRDPLPAKQLCGFIPDRPHLYEKLTGAELLEFAAGLYHIQNKAVDPAWHVPNSAWAGSLAGTVVPGGTAENPLKARWLGIFDGAGIHGTDQTY